MAQEPLTVRFKKAYGLHVPGSTARIRPAIAQLLIVRKVVELVEDEERAQPRIKFKKGQQ